MTTIVHAGIPARQLEFRELLNDEFFLAVLNCEGDVIDQYQHPRSVHRADSEELDAYYAMAAVRERVPVDVLRTALQRFMQDRRVSRPVRS